MSWMFSIKLFISYKYLMNAFRKCMRKNNGKFLSCPFWMNYKWKYFYILHEIACSIACTYSIYDALECWILRNSGLYLLKVLGNPFILWFMMSTSYVMGIKSQFSDDRVLEIRHDRWHARRRESTQTKYLGLPCRSWILPTNSVSPWEHEYSYIEIRTFFRVKTMSYIGAIGSSSKRNITIIE